MQLKLETNLPVIFLTLLVIAIVIVGFLELKKINERLKVLEYLNKGNKNDIENTKKEEKSESSELLSDENIDIEKQKNSEKNNHYVEQWHMNNDKDNIIETLNNRNEYMEEVGDEEQMYLQGGAYGPPPGVQERLSPTDEIIDKINRDENIDFENPVNDGDYYNEREEDKSENKYDNYNDNNSVVNDEKSDYESDIKDEKSVDESDEKSDEEIVDLKDVSDGEEFEKDKISVDESFSVNELKSICKNMGLQLSGNKTTLIKRIMENQ